MPTISIRNRFSSDVTVISNAFIDKYMVEANGEFVKIYLCILRWALAADGEWTLCTIADKLECTTKDVLRALRYWVKVGLMECEYNEEGQLTSLTFTEPSGSSSPQQDFKAASSSVSISENKSESVTSVRNSSQHEVRPSSNDSNNMSTEGDDSGITPPDSTKHNTSDDTVSGSAYHDSTDNAVSDSAYYSPSDDAASEYSTPSQNIHEHTIDISPSRIRTLKQSEEVRQIIYIAEQYLGHLLTNSELETILYFYDRAHFPVDLIDYLIEYCVSKNAPSLAYIKKVGFAWMDEGIRTVEEARASAFDHSHECYAIMNAYGLKGRSPAASERRFFKTWFNVYGFGLDMILLAIDKTMNQLHAPRFEYTDTILKAWKDMNVTDPGEVKLLDENHQELMKKQNEKSDKSHTRTIRTATVKTDFKGRDYDFSELEKQLLEAK